MDRLKLRLVIIEFIEVVLPSMKAENVITGETLNSEEVVKMWMGLPDCQLTQMFLGFALAKGIDIETFTPDELHLAIATVSIGVDGVEFDWIGDWNDKSKPQ